MRHRLVVLALAVAPLAACGAVCLTAAIASAPHACKGTACSSANDCPALTCRCASDGIVYDWQLCQGGCCVDACPGTTGPIRRGQACPSGCACTSGSCTTSPPAVVVGPPPDAGAPPGSAVCE